MTVRKALTISAAVLAICFFALYQLRHWLLIGPLLRACENIKPDMAESEVLALFHAYEPEYPHPGTAHFHLEQLPFKRGAMEAELIWGDAFRIPHSAVLLRIGKYELHLQEYESLYVVLENKKLTDDSYPGRDNLHIERYLIVTKNSQLDHVFRFDADGDLKNNCSSPEYTYHLYLSTSQNSSKIWDGAL